MNNGYGHWTKEQFCCLSFWQVNKVVDSGSSDGALMFELEPSNQPNKQNAGNWVMETASWMEVRVFQETSAPSAVLSNF